MILSFYTNAVALSCIIIVGILIHKHNMEGRKYHVEKERKSVIKPMLVFRASMLLYDEREYEATD